MPFDFDTMVDVKQTDAGEAIGDNGFDFDSVQPDPPVPIKEQRTSVISEVARWIFGKSPLGQMETSMYLQDKMPDLEPGEDITSYQKKVEAVLKPREKEIVAGGIGKVLEKEMQAGVAAGAVASPIRTGLALAGFTGLDKFINLRRWLDKNQPNTAPEIKDIAEVIDFGLKAFVVGGGMVKGEALLKERMSALGQPKNVNIKPETLTRLRDTGNLLPAEKVDLMKTLGVEQNQIDTAVNTGLPVNVPTDKVIAVGKKPYWDRTKVELIEPEVARENIPAIDVQPILKNIKELQVEKKLSNTTVSKLKQTIGIENIKRAELPQLEKLQTFLGDLKEGDKFLSEKQVKDLSGIIKDLPSPEITPKRIVVERFGEKDQILGEGIMKKVSPELIPTVDIKEGHPLVKRIVEDADVKFTEAEKIISLRDKEIDTLLTKAEKSRVKSLPTSEKIQRKILPQNKEIFEALGGSKVKLSPEETAAVDYLKGFFEQARKDLKLEKYRKNYITHLEKDLTEKILTDGVFSAVKSVFGEQKQADIPINIMLELDNIIGSEKFFRFAMERKGDLDPSTNIRRIVHQYSSMLETKKALDTILPEGQAIVNNLLQGKSAVWMKKYLQNLKGRGADYNFKNGPMGWLPKVGEGIVDIGYLKLLGLNYKSALKNIVAGETNSWIYQDFKTYLQGKQRYISNPKKVYAMASEYGVFDNTYAEYAQKGIGSLKKLQDLAMVGQKIGEVEIRGSIFASMLTDKEFSSGKLSPKRYREIKDTISITQGTFSKTDSPLWTQHWLGRMFFQMNRWRITNAMLLRRITNDAVKDIRAGNYKTQNTARLGKAIVAYGVGMYISSQLAKAGLTTASQITENMAQTIDGVVSLVSKGDLVKMFTENPSLSTLKEAGNTAMDVANFLHIPGAKQPRGRGIEDTYIAPVKTGEEIIEGLDELF